MKTNNLITDIIIKQIIPQNKKLKKLGFIFSIEDNYINIEYKEKCYLLKTKNNLSLNLYYKNKLLKNFKNNSIKDIINYLLNLNL